MGGQAGSPPHLIFSFFIAVVIFSGSACFEGGLPAPGLPKPGLPAPGLPEPGLPAPGLPKPGLPAPGLPKPGLVTLPLSPLGPGLPPTFFVPFGGPFGPFLSPGIVAPAGVAAGPGALLPVSHEPAAVQLGGAAGRASHSSAHVTPCVAA